MEPNRALKSKGISFFWTPLANTLKKLFAEKRVYPKFEENLLQNELFA